MLFAGEAPRTTSWTHFERFNKLAEADVCSYVPGSPTRTVETTPEGLVQVEVVNSQYVINYAFLALVYSDALASVNKNLVCSNEINSVTITSAQILAFSKQQMTTSSEKIRPVIHTWLDLGPNTLLKIP